jgi:hypothetical protein
MERDAWHAEYQGIAGTAFVVNGTEYTFDFIGAQAGRWRVWPVNNTGRSPRQSQRVAHVSVFALALRASGRTGR